MNVPTRVAAVDAPDLDTLTGALGAVLVRSRSDGKVTVVDRTPNPYHSRSHSEIVACRVAGGTAIRLLCKYGDPLRVAGDHDQRRGVGYEAAVYEAVLVPLGVSVPHFYGSFREPETGRTWLVLEYLHGALRANAPPDGQGLISAAAWIGLFHAAAEHGRGPAAAFVPGHDAGYYHGWARRTLEFARDAGEHGSWIARLCDQAGQLADALLAAPRTVAHGEYYVENILVHDGRIAPVDWETAVVAAGEIDLASLTEGWPDSIARRCEEEYRRARWPSGPPHDFERTLAAARIHWSLRWLGDRPEWHGHEGLRWRFTTLRRLAETIGLI